MRSASGGIATFGPIAAMRPARSRIVTSWPAPDGAVGAGAPARRTFSIAKSSPGAARASARAKGHARRTTKRAASGMRSHSGAARTGSDEDAKSRASP
jgi:hypothetical protein